MIQPCTPHKALKIYKYTQVSSACRVQRFISECPGRSGLSRLPGLEQSQLQGVPLAESKGACTWGPADDCRLSAFLHLYARVVLLKGVHALDMGPKTPDLCPARQIQFSHGYCADKRHVPMLTFVAPSRAIHPASHRHVAIIGDAGMPEGFAT